ncbi:MAG TPA: glycosyltransferase, partial [Flavobacteriia bacterium]|nr:glycosyltransferase [Flavobacteriia bacterium]
EDNLIKLINSLNIIDYPKSTYEILFVDDESTDNSVYLIKKQLSKEIDYKIIKNIRHSNSPKKDAIETAIKKAKYSWIITTDADCEVSKNWLQILQAKINDSNAVFIAMPVNYKANNSFLEQFQKIDFSSLIGSTIGSFGQNKPIMCNGANLCYNKDVFNQVNGYENNNNIASGDDIFLMEKMYKNYPNRVEFLKSFGTTVYTKPVNNLHDLIQQRIRWASKTSSTKNSWVKIIGLIVFLFNLLISISILWYGYLCIKNIESTFFIFGIILIIKMILDFWLLTKTYHFLKEKLKWQIYFIVALIHPYFICSIPILAAFKKYKWKERMFNK